MNPRPSAVKDATAEGATAEVKETDIDAAGEEDVGEELRPGAKVTDLDAAAAEQDLGEGDTEGNLISFPVKFDEDEDAGFNWAANLGRGEKQGTGEALLAGGVSGLRTQADAESACTLGVQGAPCPCCLHR